MIEGFKELYIRDVPFGAVLNAETANSYPLISSNTWYSPDYKYFIQPEPNNTYTLACNHNDMRLEHVKKYWECPEFSSFNNNSVEELEKLYNKYLK